ncbi:hydroxyethylthiazole kinase [Oscillospiraceae bacterium LTW-04]|nr:hydroxyethylthiazole kinase [Oscillospiraceae bacterium MB24-C1]
MKQTIQNIRDKKPLVHCITNFVTVNDCANIILAAGGTPTMAHDIREVEEIVSIASALVLNLGTVGDIDAMIAAGRRANALGKPIVLDPVAAGASRLRNESCAQILKELKLSVIRGNISEIKSLAIGHADTRGVDAGEKDVVTEKNLEAVCKMAKNFAKATGSVIAISGRLDIIADAEHACVITNGCGEMAQITGSGCMLTALIGTFAGAQPDDLYTATFEAVSAMGLCGELAREKMLVNHAGTASFRTYLIDAVSLLTDHQLEGGQRIENR